MANLKDVVGFFCDNYPDKGELSKARLTKLVYLADWKSIVDRGQQITDIAWEFNHYGPYVDDVLQLAYHDQDFNVERSENMFGNSKEIISIKKPFSFDSLQDDEKSILDHVIIKTKPLNWSQFIKLVYSTFPVLVSSRYETFDLVALGKRYHKEILSQ